ncbi:hypothetical protein [Streptomyces sp. LN325]|uniref:hypothetical protein n=1 Tax=Streptomyces sp. LN325 TaxID=3112976 RepID=UPI00371853DD
MNTYPRRQVLGATAAAAAATALPLTTASGARAAEPADGRAGQWVPVPAPLPVPLDAHFDNDGIGRAAAPGGDFDGSGYTFPGEELPEGPVEVDGIAFLFPSSAAGARNNVVALGQRLDLPRGRYLSALFLTAGSYGDASGTATVHYADGSTTTAGLGGADWYATGGSLSAPYRYRPDGGKDEHGVGIGTAEVWIDPRREAVALTLPTTRPAGRTRPRCTSSPSPCNRWPRGGRWPCGTRTPPSRCWSRAARRAWRPPSSTPERSPSSRATG